MKRRSLFIRSFSLLFIFSLFLVGCGQEKQTTSPEEPAKEAIAQTKNLLVYTSMYPIYDFTAKIAGDRAEVINLVPPGAEPHDYEPSAKDLVRLSESDVFIYNGSGMELWIEKVLDSLDTSKMQIVSMSDHVSLLSLEETGHASHDEHGHEEEAAHKDEHGHKEEATHKDEHGHKEEAAHKDEHGHKEEAAHKDEHAHEDKSKVESHEHEHGESIHDPHFWLDPVRAKEMAVAIKDALILADKDGKDIYEANYQAVLSDLNQLDADFKTMVEHSKRKEFIVSHDAFGYLSSRYGLEQIAISGITPSDEPTQKELDEVITFAKEHDVKYILFETLVSAKIGEIVKQEIGAESLVLNPLEGLTEEDIAQGKDYFSVMRDNLESLKKALESH
jgi:zinc transport system substrate-binding protein